LSIQLEIVGVAEVVAGIATVVGAAIGAWQKRPVKPDEHVQTL